MGGGGGRGGLLNAPKYTGMLMDFKKIKNIQGLGKTF
jgi:hypothetical protein